MSPRYFVVHEHTLPCSHIRGYDRSTADGSDMQLHLAVKQYVPNDNPQPRPGDITIIGAHANGFPKELYEPLWDDLYLVLKKSNLRIRSIWIADVAWQGYSSVLNEGKLGNDPWWLDHSLDLLHMINHFAPLMPRPIFGIGHSMGGCQIAQLSLLHPRLFQSIVLIDPVIASEMSNGNFRPALASVKRRDIWQSRSAAATSYNKSPFYKAWDPRVLALWVEHGLRDLPTLLHPDQEHAGGVTLRTTKHHEVHSFLRPARNIGADDETPNIDSHPDLPRNWPAEAIMYRPEPRMVFEALPRLRPATLYVFGAHSDLSLPPAREKKLELTGTDIGGSGGVQSGRVKEVVLQTGHLVPMERASETADAAGEWLVKWYKHWENQERAVAQRLARVPMNERANMPQQMIDLATGGAKKPKL